MVTKIHSHSVQDLCSIWRIGGWLPAYVVSLYLTSDVHVNSDVHGQKCGGRDQKCGAKHCPFSTVSQSPGRNASFTEELNFPENASTILK